MGQAARYRLWWLFPTMVIAGTTEVAGWAARLYSSFKPLSFTPYLLQSVYRFKITRSLDGLQV
jgi:hypothetical protein